MSPGRTLLPGLRPRDGLTVLELLLAGFITAIAIIALAVLFIRGLQLQRKSAVMLQATGLARQEVEQIRALPSSALPAPMDFQFDGRVPDATVSGFPPTPYPAVELDGVQYQLLVQGSPGPDSLRRLRVEVFSAQTHFVTETLLAP